MAKRLVDLDLEELYAKEKITPGVAKAIKAKEDFSQIQPTYCETVCKLKCKSYNQQYVDSNEVDVVVIQDHKAFSSQWKSEDDEERIRENVVGHLLRTHFGGASSKTVNVMKCRPTFAALGRKKVATQSEMLHCSPYALQEIEQAKPKVIICMSTIGAKMLGLKASIFNERGEVRYYNGIPVVITLHPAYIMMIRQQSSGKMWGPDYFEVVNRDFKKAAWLADGRLTIPDLDEAIRKAEKEQIKICRSNQDVEDFMSIVYSKPEDKMYSFDLETTSLDPWAPDARILTAQFGFRAEDGRIHSYVIPLWHRENNDVDPDQAWQAILPLFTEKYSKTGHNLKFDVLYTAVTQGVRIKGIKFDTMLQLHDINSGIQGNYGLKRAVWDFLPSSGLAGYEDKLPKLTKKKKGQKNA